MFGSKYIRWSYKFIVFAKQISTFLRVLQAVHITMTDWEFTTYRK